MGKDKLRIDKTCLNCRHVVENRYCPNCGQENTDTRKTFHHLFIHFFEDLTHYENAFWKTIRNLLFKPSSLSKEYLSGKRLSYLAPVRLYIFISFITFFLITVIPDNDISSGIKDDLKQNSKKMTAALDSIQKKDSLNPDIKKIQKLVKSRKFTNDTIPKKSYFNLGFESIEELDSIQKFSPEEDKLPEWLYNYQKNFLEIRDKNSKEELIEKFKESFMHNFPKVLFIYMPFFAFFLWLFHGKKRWYYFEHGIFTLHYFSFLLLLKLIMTMFEGFLCIFGNNFVTIAINGLFTFIGFCWMFYYFFPAHHRFYGESRIISLIKSLALLFINIILMSIIMFVFVAYTFLTIH